MSDTQVTIYGNDVCPYCLAARTLLTKKGIAFTDIPVMRGQPIFNEMVEKSGRQTVPQIFIADAHIGGFDDLYALDQNGELDKLLADDGESS